MTSTENDDRDVYALQVLLTRASAASVTVRLIRHLNYKLSQPVTTW